MMWAEIQVVLDLMGHDIMGYETRALMCFSFVQLRSSRWHRLFFA